VYVLAFEEGAFSQGELDLWQDFCDLIGLPSGESTLGRTAGAGEDGEGERIGGLRRQAFSLCRQNEDSNGANNDSSDTTVTGEKDNKGLGTSASATGGNNAVDDGSDTACGMVNHFRAGFLQQLLFHIGMEFQNCFKVFVEEIIGDGRIFNSHASLREKVNSGSDTSFCSTSHTNEEEDQQELNGENSHDNDGQNENQGDGTGTTIDKEDTTYSARSRQEESQRAIRPTLAFEIALPYKSTSMEVTSLEWNTDGTALTIIQRRKGSSITAATTAVANNQTPSPIHNVSTLGPSGGIFLSRTGNFVTNNKKKNQNNNRAVGPNPTLSGNTALSFWTIPEWLLLDYEDSDSLFFGDGENHQQHPHRYDEDGIVLRAPGNGNGECGWEVEEDEENTALFPMWEWYLAKHVFKDETSMNRMIKKEGENGGRPGMILMKNMMEVQAYPMELVASSLTGNPSGVSGRHGKKGGSRSNRGGGGQSDNASVMMNGDVTCLFWEETSQIVSDSQIEEKENEEKEKGSSSEDGDQNEEQGQGSLKISSSNSFKDVKDAFKSLSSKKVTATASKWVVMGTSKGQVILHNCAASCLSHQSKKMRNNSSGSMPNIVTSICPPHGRTITIPLRHKKRITCGAWLDNMLVFGSVGSGNLTVVSTFPKTQPAPESPNIAKNKAADDLFRERTVKVLGNIPLPGGRDAFSVQIGSIEDDSCGSSILSVNCERRCLLFYTFPRILSDENSTNHASITSPAIEISFSMNSSTEGAIDDDVSNSSQLKAGLRHRGTTCGNILEHYLIPNTCLVLVAFSPGYFTLVDWANGIILSDAEVVSKRNVKRNTMPSSPSSATNQSSGRDSNDHFLLDVAFHAPTSTFACLTHSGYIVVFQIRLMHGCNDMQGDDCICTTGIVINTKTHTCPKTKSSSGDKSSSPRENFFGRESFIMLGTIDTLCSRKIDRIPGLPSDGRKASLINFSADGECVSVSFGDESVSLYAIRYDEAELDREKLRLEESIYVGKDQLILVFMFSTCTIIAWFWNQSRIG